MRAVTVVGVVAVVLTAIAAGTGGAVPGAIQEASPDRPITADRSLATNHSDTNASNVSFGAQLSSFMQSSAAQASGSIENGMWEAAYDNASNRSRTALVDRRTTQLSEQIAELQAQKRALQAAKRNGTITNVEYRSRLSRIVGQLAALKESIESVNRTDAPGANRSKIADLSRRADQLAGQEVSEVARSLGGPRGSPGPPEWLEPGPGGDADRPNNASDGGPPEDPGGQGKANTSGAGDGTGKPSDAGNGTATGESGGPDDAGNGGSNGNAGGSDQSGSGSDNAGNGSSDQSDGGDSGGNNAGNGSDGNQGKGSGNGSDDGNDQGGGNDQGKGKDKGSGQGQGQG